MKAFGMVLLLGGMRVLLGPMLILDGIMLTVTLGFVQPPLFQWWVNSAKRLEGKIEDALREAV